MLSDAAREALNELCSYRETPDGVRVVTHCMYPSFEPVSVSIDRVGDGYRVGDLRGAFDSAWLHGRDEVPIARALQREAKRRSLLVVKRSIVSHVIDASWLSAAILAVANASSAAAERVVASAIASHEAALVDQIENVLLTSFGDSGFSKEIAIKGKSGGERHFDFMVRSSGREILINGISPHHASISAKYVSFADMDLERNMKFAVYSKKLHTDDVSLLQQVSTIVPLPAVGAGARRLLHV